MKRWGTLAGSAFALLIMAVVLYSYGGDLKGVRFTNTAAGPKFAASIALYVVVILLGAFGWRILLSALGNPLPWRSAGRQVLIPQIGKYLPGNFAHYLGRATMTAQSGVPPATIGIALAAEVGATIAGGLLAIAMSVGFAPELKGSIRTVFPNAPPISSPAIVTGVFLVSLCTIIVPILLRQFKRMPQLRLGGLLAAVAVYGISFVLLGISLRFIASSLSSLAVPLPLSVALFAAAWIAGLVTPGAPGGLGVRETVLTIGLAPILGGSVALAVALLHRGVSVLGDVISFGFGLLLPNTEKGGP